MKMRMFFVAILLMMTAGYEAFADNPVRIAITVERLRVREEPSTGSKIIAVLNKGDSVYDVERTKKTYRIGKLKARWIRIRFKGDVEGWVFGAYTGPERLSAGHIYMKAFKLEEKNPERSIALYKSIISKYPNSISYHGFHGSVPFIDISKKRISIVRCKSKKKEKYHYSSFDGAIAVLVEAIKSNNKGLLIDNSPCDILISLGPIGKWKNIETVVEGIKLSDIDVNKFKKYESHIIFKSKTTSHSYMFIFKKTELGWKWTQYEEMEHGLMFD